MLSPSVHIYPFFYNRVFNGASFSSDRTIFKEDHIRHFAPMVPSFLRQIRCPCLRSRMRSVWRRISLLTPPSKIFQPSYFKFSPHEEFHSISVLTYLAKSVTEYSANYTSFSYQARKWSIIIILRHRFEKKKPVRKSSRYSVIFFSFLWQSVSIKLNENDRCPIVFYTLTLNFSRDKSHFSYSWYILNLCENRNEFLSL